VVLVDPKFVDRETIPDLALDDLDIDLVQVAYYLMLVVDHSVVVHNFLDNVVLVNNYLNTVVIVADMVTYFEVLVLDWDSFYMHAYAMVVVVLDNFLEQLPLRRRLLLFHFQHLFEVIRYQVMMLLVLLLDVPMTMLKLDLLTMVAVADYYDLDYYYYY
jgi:hypothetical protein